jgi:PIN domain nuclease of toxin-antitoxin system
LLAFLFQETGFERVELLLEESVISTVNLAEVLGRFARDGHDPHQALQHLERGPFEIASFGPTDAARVAALVPRTSPYGLSLGDRACLALALSRGISALTADRTWVALEVGVPIEVIR